MDADETVDADETRPKASHHPPFPTQHLPQSHFQPPSLFDLEVKPSEAAKTLPATLSNLLANKTSAVDSLLHPACAATAAPSCSAPSDVNYTSQFNVSTQTIIECTGVPLESISNFAMGECGVRTTADPRVFGPPTWRTLHIAAQNYPTEPIDTVKAACVAFVNSVAYMLGCPHCGYDFIQFIKTNDLYEGKDPWNPACKGSQQYNMPCQGPTTACENQANLVNFFLRAHCKLCGGGGGRRRVCFYGGWVQVGACVCFSIFYPLSHPPPALPLRRQRRHPDQALQKAVDALHGGRCVRPGRGLLRQQHCVRDEAAVQVGRRDRLRGGVREGGSERGSRESRESSAGRPARGARLPQPLPPAAGPGRLPVQRWHARRPERAPRGRVLVVGRPAGVRAGGSAGLNPRMCCVCV